MERKEKTDLLSPYEQAILKSQLQRAVDMALQAKGWIRFVRLVGLGISAGLLVIWAVVKPGMKEVAAKAFSSTPYVGTVLELLGAVFPQLSPPLILAWELLIGFVLGGIVLGLAYVMYLLGQVRLGTVGLNTEDKILLEAGGNPKKIREYLEENEKTLATRAETLKKIPHYILEIGGGVAMLILAITENERVDILAVEIWSAVYLLMAGVLWRHSYRELKYIAGKPSRNFLIFVSVFELFLVIALIFFVVEWVLGIGPLPLLFWGLLGMFGPLTLLGGWIVWANREQKGFSLSRIGLVLLRGAAILLLFSAGVGMSAVALQQMHSPQKMPSAAPLSMPGVVGNAPNDNSQKDR